MLGRWGALLWAGVGVTVVAARAARGEQAEPAVAAGDGAPGAFVQAAHARLHRRWAEGTLRKLGGGPCRPGAGWPGGSPRPPWGSRRPSAWRGRATGAWG